VTLFIIVNVSQSRFVLYKPNSIQRRRFRSK